MRMTAALLALFLLIPAALHAQQGGMGRGGMGTGGGPMMAMAENVPEFVASKAAELQLTETQLQSVQAIARKLEEERAPILEQLRAGMAQGGGMPDRARMMESRDRVMKLTDDAQKALDEVLSAEQREKSAALVEEWRRTRPQMRRGGG
jgi:uncharacterized protein (DUF2235 family)